VNHELLPGPGQERRRFRRSGFESSTAASEELGKVVTLLALPKEGNSIALMAICDVLALCAKKGKPLPEATEILALLSIADDQDAEAMESVCQLIVSCFESGSPLPQAQDVKRRLASDQVLDRDMTVAEWLDEWLKDKKKGLRPSGYTRYEIDVRVHLKPHLGHIKLNKLGVKQISAMFDAIDETNLLRVLEKQSRRAALDYLATIPWKGVENRALRKELKAAIAEMPPFRRPTSSATQPHIRDTLRAALNVAIGRRVVENFNPAVFVELAERPSHKALMWTEERVLAWQATGVIPSPVMVWTPEQVGQFLDAVEQHRLYMLFHLIAFRGLRRGEGCGSGWDKVNRRTRMLSVERQLRTVGGKVIEGAPKTKAGFRQVALDAESLDGLDQHKRQQTRERLAAGDKWVDSGYIFTEEDGSPLNPNAVSDLFQRLMKEIGLPPIRLHDLRHVAATLALTAGVDIKIVSEMLCHSATAITRDIYQSVLDELFHAAAEAVIALVPRARRQASQAAGSDSSLASTTDTKAAGRDAPRYSKARSTWTTW
jgi:hypothetical protein